MNNPIQSPTKLRRAPVLPTVTIVLAGIVFGNIRTAFADDGWYKHLNSSNADWMASVPGDEPLSHLSIPGTHETLALHGGVSSQCQESMEDGSGVGGKTLSYQFLGGIRAIDIRVRIVAEQGQGKFVIHHGVVYQEANFDDVLRELRSFLQAHPRETVLLALKAECTGGSSSCADELNCDICMQPTDVRHKAIFNAYRDANRDLFWWPSASGQAPVPKLDDVRGKVVLVNFMGPQGGNYTDYGLEQLNYAPWPGENEPQNNCYVQDIYKITKIDDINDKWEKVHRQLDRTNQAADCRDPSLANADMMYFNWTNGSGTFLDPYTIAGGTKGATGVNQFLYQCLAGTNNGRCDTASMKRTGAMMIDFPGGGLVEQIIDRNPGHILPPPLGSKQSVGDPMEQHPGGDDGGRRSGSSDHPSCRPDGLLQTNGVNVPYCSVYQDDGREWLGEGRTRRIVGYFNGGRTGADGKPYYLVKNIPWSKVTHINYAFAHIENSQISVGADGPNNAATGMEWPGVAGAEMDPSLPYKGHFNQLTKYKKLHPRVKTLISVGGWADSGGYYALTTNADGSTNTGGITSFADSVVDFLRRYGFDGVDIDYEYPTALDETGNPSDWDTARSRRGGLASTYADLMKTLRDKLDRASAADGRYYLLTSASSSSGFLVRGMENQKALRYLDFTNLMAYDYHGTWNDVVGPNAPLYDDGQDPELSDLYTTPEYQHIGYFNTDWAFHYMRGALQAGRINIGIPYYTRGWKNVAGGNKGMWGSASNTQCEPGTGIKRPCGNGATGIDNIWHDQTANGAELGSGINPLWHVKNLEQNILPNYAEQLGLHPRDNPDDALSGTYERAWDPTTRTAWLWNETKKTFLSIEDGQSIDAIVDYVRASGAGGVMMWELAGDYECPQEPSADRPCIMGYTLTSHLSDRLAGAAPYGETRSAGSSVQPLQSTLNVSVDLVQYSSDTTKLWPLQPVLRITNNTGVSIGGAKNSEISFDIPTSAPALIKDGNWQTAEQGGQWRVTPGHTGPNAGGGLLGDFHRVSAALDYCQMIAPGQSLDLPIIYYLPLTGPVNTQLVLGGQAFGTTTEGLRGGSEVAPPAAVCMAAAWDAGAIYDPTKQPIEQTTVRYQGKIWHAKWWTQGNAPGTGADADHEPWKYVGPE